MVQLCRGLCSHGPERLLAWVTDVAPVVRRQTVKHAIIHLEEERRALEEALQGLGRGCGDSDLRLTLLREIGEVESALKVLRACSPVGVGVSASILRRSPKPS